MAMAPVFFGRGETVNDVLHIQSGKMSGRLLRLERERRVPPAGAAGPGHRGAPVRDDLRRGEEPSYGSGKITKDENGAFSVVSAYHMYLTP